MLVGFEKILIFSLDLVVAFLAWLYLLIIEVGFPTEWYEWWILVYELFIYIIIGQDGMIVDELIKYECFSWGIELYEMFCLGN